MYEAMFAGELGVTFFMGMFIMFLTVYLEQRNRQSCPSASQLTLMSPKCQLELV